MLHELEVTPLCVPRQATGQFMGDYQALSLVQQCDHVSVQWYLLEDSDATLAEMAPHTVPIVPLFAGGSPTAIWPPKRRAAPMYPTRLGEGGPDLAGAIAGAAEEGSDADPDQDFGDRDEQQSESDLDGLGDLEELSAPLLEALEPTSNEAVEGEAAAPAGSDGIQVAAPSVGRASDIAPHVPQPVPKALPGRRGGSTVILQCPGGSVAFYGARHSFEAVCQHPGHGRCVLTRTCKGKRNATAEGGIVGGRPVAFLASWLAYGEGVATKDEHWAEAAFDQPREERARLRAAIRDSGESGALLLGCERPLEAGEPEEPATLVGYWSARG